MRHRPIEVPEAMELLELGKSLTKRLRKLDDMEAKAARNLYWLKDSTIKELATKFGVCYDTMWDVIHRRGAYNDEQ